MESLWKKTEKELLETKEELEKECEADVCIIGRRNYWNKYSILFKQRRQKSSNTRKRKLGR